MTTHKDKILVIGLHRWMIYIFGVLSLIADFDITLCDVFGILCLSTWVWSQVFNRLELKLLDKIRSR